MKKLFSATGLVILVFLMLMACDGGEKMKKRVDYQNFEDVPVAAWKALSQKTVFFGHQSVGFNIIEGVEDIKNEKIDTIDLNILEAMELENHKNGVFAHFKVGENKDPLSKINDFAERMEQNRAAAPDVAFFKFCYVDINAETDTQAVFNAYKETMQSLRESFPETTFVHVTVPLRIVQMGVKAWIKKLIGKPIGGYADNIARNRFNELLRREYSQTAPVYDLAKAESTTPDGSRCEFTRDGKAYYALVPAYTEDGGHLNAAGRKAAAEELLVCLAELTGTH